jgi:hypothetical protein
MVSECINWNEQFRDAILTYNKNRQPDPFMCWFRCQEAQEFFDNDFQKVLVVLVDARFDQMTTAENALENTKTVVLAGCLRGAVELDALPVLIPIQYFSAESWTESFVHALPYLQALARRIISQKNWNACELCDLMLREMKTPYLGVKTTRLAIRWLYELLPCLNIDMMSYDIPIDRLVYRVSCRLGLLNPNSDKYTGQGSEADVKLQRIVRNLLPGKQWIFDEPLWSTGRRAVNGGHCFPINPDCQGCIFEEICPRQYLDFDPATVGIQTPATFISTINKEE